MCACLRLCMNGKVNSPKDAVSVWHKRGKAEREKRAATKKAHEER